MNSKFKFLAKLLLLHIFLLTTFWGFTQRILKDTFNNEVLYVYPFGNDIAVHSNYYLAEKKISRNRNTYKQYYINLFGENYNKKDFRKSKKLLALNSFSRRNKNTQANYFNGKFKKAVRQNPFPLLENRYTLENDIIPCLDEIPDGKYIQYFKDYYPMGQNGKIVYEEKCVAGIFFIKNNLLDGEAIWYNVKGDVLKKGRFEKGLKVGKWLLETRKVEYNLSAENVRLYCERGYPQIDTIREIVHFDQGLKNGHYSFFLNSANPIFEGTFKNNQPIGEWTERAVGFIGKGKNRTRNRNNSIITWEYTEGSTDAIVHQPLIRSQLISDNSYSTSYNFNPKFEPAVDFNKMYVFNFPKELDIELAEEKLNSYEGEEFEEEMYGEDYYLADLAESSNDDNSAFKHLIYDEQTNKYVSMSKLIDSLGIIFKYDGVYEKHYPNGQLMVHYEFENGKLKLEDTIFWDNGKPYDIVAYQVDSNYFIQSIFDYDGNLFNEIVFDQKGEFKRVNFQPEKVKYIIIDGLKVEDQAQGKYFFYDKLDTLQFPLKDSLILFQSWNNRDTSLLYSRIYVPDERILSFRMYSFTGKPALNAELKFNENFESWSGQKQYSLGNLTMVTTTSATYDDLSLKDSISQRHVNSFSEAFVLSDDYQLQQKGIPFTGNISLSFNEKKFKLKSDKSIKLELPRAFSMTYKLMKDIYNYRSSGKLKNDILLNTIDGSEIDEDFGAGIYSSIFGGLISEYLEYPYVEYFDDQGNKKVNLKNQKPLANKLIGYMHDGKPQGSWKVIDQFGELMVEIPFEKGLINGTVKQFDIANPSFEIESLGQPEYLKDSQPTRKTHYLSATTEYKNGVINGVVNKYNWIKEIIEQQYFKDGYLEGSAFERNNLAFTSLNYHNGSLDGYVKTFLTLVGKDSILLFDLNFQNGMLQGESKAYHTNGKLAKKGFFLNGEPIDDYEAYDSLGFRYHYVKFLYSFPVEEKIWEENELSVRYEYDWRDSIYFQPTDITTSQSLERILAQLGIGGDYYELPYYGRPSLVDKTGIDYKITKYYPNDTVARIGNVSAGRKVGCWKYFSYNGEFLYDVDYFDTLLVLNDSIQFKAKGLLTDYNSNGEKISESYIIEKFEKYDCSHTDHYEIRQLMTVWQGNVEIDRMNGLVKNYFDNGVLQNEGMMKDGLPTGLWKFYDPFGKLNFVGNYLKGKRDGRWLGGDLSKTKYLGDICLNPNLPDIEEEIKYREKLLNIVITNYNLGKVLSQEFYDVNLNDFSEEELFNE